MPEMRNVDITDRKGQFITTSSKGNGAIEGVSALNPPGFPWICRGHDRNTRVRRTKNRVDIPAFGRGFAVHARNITGTSDIGCELPRYVLARGDSGPAPPALPLVEHLLPEALLISERGDAQKVKLCQQEKDKKHLTCENTVPEVGLELHSSPYQHWAPPETCGIRRDSTPVRPSPAAKVCTMCTPQNGRSAKLTAALTSTSPASRSGLEPCKHRSKPVDTFGDEAGSERAERQAQLMRRPGGRRKSGSREEHHPGVHRRRDERLGVH